MVPRLAVILPTMFLVAIGLVMVYSSSSIVSFVEEGDSSGEALKQVLFAVIGTIAAVAAYRFATQNNLRGKIGWGYYYVCIALLILTPLVGSEALGATRWIRIGPVGIQASEFLKIALVVAMALYVCIALLILTPLVGSEALGATRWIRIGPVGIQASEFLKIALVVAMALIAEEYATGRIDVLDAIKRVGLLIVVPLLFLYLTQSDLGTTMICFVGLFTVLVCAGLPRSIIVAMALFAVLFVVISVVATGYRSDRMIFLDPWSDPDDKGYQLIHSFQAIAMALFAVLFVVISVVATGYRSDRMIFLDPWSDPDDKGYQLIHSFQAIASGGFFGTGVGNSYEKLQYLPEAETDFIFAIICEELGFVGGAGVIVAFVILAYGGMRIASKATSPFGSFVAAGLVAIRGRGLGRDAYIPGVSQHRVRCGLRSYHGQAPAFHLLGGIVDDIVAPARWGGAGDFVRLPQRRGVSSTAG